MLDPHLLAAAHGHLRQFEPVSELQAGHYDAVTTVDEVFAGCTVGLGVAEAADGEIIAVDGEVWRIPADGTPVIAPGRLGMPFGIAAAGGQSVSLRAVDGADAFATVTAAVDALRASAEADATTVVALRLDGDFTDVLLRSEPRQDPPYRPLSDVLDHEIRFAFDVWSGTLAGFCFPMSSDAVSIPGLHMHAISADRASGGHCHRAVIRQAELTLWFEDVEIVVP